MGSRYRLLTAAAGLTLAVTPVQQAHGDEPDPPEVTGGADYFGVVEGVTVAEDAARAQGSQGGAARGAPAFTTVTRPHCDLGGIFRALPEGPTTCATYQTCGDEGQIRTFVWQRFADGTYSEPTLSCSTVPGVAVVTPAMVLQAFREVPLPESVLEVQPPGGVTLVNFETNFFTAAEPFTETVTLLGQSVELEIWASGFSWRFGDGAVRSTTTPGAPYPQLVVTHAYGQAGEVGPSVDTTWSARFRVGGGEWRAVPDTVTMTGAPAALTIREATPVLVD